MSHDFTLKKYPLNEILPFAAIWIDLEGVMLSEIKSERERQILYNVTYMWNLKNTTS